MDNGLKTIGEPGYSWLPRPQSLHWDRRPLGLHLVDRQRPGAFHDQHQKVLSSLIVAFYGKLELKLDDNRVPTTLISRVAKTSFRVTKKQFCEPFSISVI